MERLLLRLATNSPFGMFHLAVVLGDGVHEDHQLLACTSWRISGLDLPLVVAAVSRAPLMLSLKLLLKAYAWALWHKQIFPITSFSTLVVSTLKSKIRANGNKEI